jgi:ubiquinone/menaquinone biosynthesis C-methylase UbiE
MDRLLEATRQAEEAHFWFRGFRAFVRPLAAIVTAGVPDAKILDCGCGTGANLGLLEEFGHASGFDFTWRGLEFAREYGYRRVAQASATDIPFASGTFQLVTAFDLLQVLPDPMEAQALSEMFRVLRPGGGLIVNVAALDFLRGTHAVLGAEVRRYTRRRLRRVIEAAGFEVSRLTYTNFSLLPLMAVVRAAQRVRGLPPSGEGAVDTQVPPAPVNGLLASLVLLEAKAVRRMDMPIGSSVLCLARKRG